MLHTRHARVASGRGEIYSFVIAHRAFHPFWADKVPYVSATIELEEGVRLLTNIVGCAPDAVRIGMAVDVVFEDVTPNVTLPRFPPRAASDE